MPFLLYIMEGELQRIMQMPATKKPNFHTSEGIQFKIQSPQSAPAPDNSQGKGKKTSKFFNRQ